MKEFLGYMNLASWIDEVVFEHLNDVPSEDIQKHIKEGWPCEIIDKVDASIAEMLRDRLPLSEEIITAIYQERLHQDTSWGTIEDHPHSIFEWAGIMESELMEAREAFFNPDADNQMLAEILQVVTVGIACLQQHRVVTRNDLEESEDES